MDFAEMLRELWRKKLWVLGGVLVAVAVAVYTAYDVDVRSLSIQKKGLEVGAASTEILVDSKNSAIASIGGSDPGTEPFDVLARHADVLAQLLTSPPLKRAIAREAGLRNVKIAARPPVDQTATQNQRQQASEERANALLNESTGQRLFFDRKEDVPVISVYAEAPSEREALKLASGVTPALSKYIRRLERKNPTLPGRANLRVTQLGDARGGTVNEGANRTVALLAFLGTFLVACILILVSSTVARDWRRAAAMERGELVWRGTPGAVDVRDRDPRTVTSVPARLEDADVVDADEDHSNGSATERQGDVSWIRRSRGA